MPSKSNPDLVAAHAAEEIHNDAIHLGKMLEGELGTMGAKQLAKGAMLELVARHWNDRNPIYGPQHTPFREWLLLTMGPTHFMTLYEEGAKRGLLHPDPGPPALTGLGGAPGAPGLPPSLAVQPTPPSLPAPLVGAMTNANG